MVLPKFCESLEQTKLLGNLSSLCKIKGFIWEIAPEFNALVVFAEHRYYGQSLPYGNNSFTKPYIQYLTSEQALADYAYLITDIKRAVSGAQDAPVVVFGGSYGSVSD